MNEGYKRKRNSSFKAIYCAAELGIKITCTGHSTLFHLCKLCGDQVPPFDVVKYWLQLFTALLNDMLIFQAGVIQPVSACSVMLYSLVLHLPSGKLPNELL